MEFKYINKQKHKKNTAVRIHTHNCYEVIFCSYGLGIVYFSDKRVPYGNDSMKQTNYPIDQITEKSVSFKDSSIILVPPGMIHSESYMTDETEILSIGFITDSVTDFSFFPNVTSEFNVLFNSIYYEFINKHPFYIENINSYLSICVNNLMRMKTIEKNDVNTRGMDYIINYFKEYFNTNINIDVMASMSGYSKDHFRYLFKRETGVSPHKYLIMLRLGCAKDMIVNTKRSLNEIAEFCGYDNYYHFIVIFKKFFGISPSSFRKNHVKLIQK